MADDSLSRFERYIETLLEGTFTQLFAGRLHPGEVALALARAMEDHADKNDDGRNVAPDMYIVRLNEMDHAAILATRPNLSDELGRELMKMARSVGYTLIIEPSVRLIATQGQRPHTVEVTARHSEEAISATSTMDLPANSARINMPPAMLVFKNGRKVPLDRPLINIGRHRDNHIIVDDGRVSRHHAQIRLRFGEYVLFDTGSSGGTEVNNMRVTEATLRSGDVISFAGHTALFLQPDAPQTSSYNVS